MKKGGVLNLLNKIEKLDIKAISEQAINATADSIKQANQEQLYDGLLSSGYEIEPEYSQRTIEIKELKGQPTDRVTLQDTGEWYKGITVEAQNGRVIVDNTDGKTNDLKEKYSSRILGIGGLYKSKYIATKLNPKFLKIIKDATGL